MTYVVRAGRDCGEFVHGRPRPSRTRYAGRMQQTALLAFLAGLIGANSIPHFVKGITKEKYPTVFGDSPVTNLIAGWTGLILTVLCVHWADVGRAPMWAFGTGALGVLLMGLFHAWHGALGRRPSASPRT